jgi:transcriptional/translational regulatory protein YebC/TACO1
MISAGGSSSFLFTKKGIIIFQKGDKQEEQVMDDAVELGASELDFREGSDEVLIETEGRLCLLLFSLPHRCYHLRFRLPYFPSSPLFPPPSLPSSCLCTSSFSSFSPPLSGEGKVKEVMRLKTGLTSKGYSVISAQVMTVPTDTLELEDQEELRTFQKLVDALEDLEDVHNVYHNVAL